jgi:hypothetical protein
LVGKTNFVGCCINEILNTSVIMLWINITPPDCNVATLALGSRPRQRGCKGAGQREARESHQGLSGV